MFSKGAQSNLFPYFTMLLRAVNWKNVENMPFKNEWILEEVMKSVAILNLHKNNLFWGKSLWKHLLKKSVGSPILTQGHM